MVTVRDSGRWSFVVDIRFELLMLVTFRELCSKLHNMWTRRGGHPASPRDDVCHWCPRVLTTFPLSFCWRPATYSVDDFSLKHPSYLRMTLFTCFSCHFSSFKDVICRVVWGCHMMMTFAVLFEMLFVTSFVTSFARSFFRQFYVISCVIWCEIWDVIPLNNYKSHLKSCLETSFEKSSEMSFGEINWDVISDGIWWCPLRYHLKCHWRFHLNFTFEMSFKISFDDVIWDVIWYVFQCVIRWRHSMKISDKLWEAEEEMFHESKRDVQ